MTTLLRYLEYVGRLLAAAVGFSIVLVPAHLLRLTRRRRLILVAERGVDARDNGWHFFRYLLAQEDAYEVRYVIAPDSPDASRIPPQHAVAFRSLHHYLLYAFASIDASSHLHGANPFGVVGALFRPLLPAKITVLLRHGVTKDHWSLSERALRQTQFVVSGARAEYDYLKRSFPAQLTRHLRLTGLARFDALRSGRAQEKLVLFMPTFRKYIFNLSRYPTDVAEAKVRASPYFQGLVALLEHPDLETVLRESGYRLIFYPHHSAQFIAPWLPKGGDRIDIALRGTHDVQELLQRAAVLVTDFSSVFFDFGFMRKPVMYYQFDRDDYRKDHYEEGYFSYESHGFGPVITTADGTVERLRALLAADARIEPQFEQRIEQFFSLEPSGNSARILAAIKVVAAEQGIVLDHGDRR